MATARPFAYNTGSTISGTIQVGDLAVGTPTTGFTGSMEWWNGADEELGYVIAGSVPSDTQPAPDGRTASVQFWRSSALTESSFIELANYVTGQSFTGGTQASTYLTTNGYWNSWILPTPTPTPTNTPTPTPTPTLTPTNTPTPTPTPIPPPISTFIGSSGSSVSASTYTFTNQNYGGAGYIIICVGTRYATPPNVRFVSSVTLNGVTATSLTGGATGNISTQIFGVRITGGTSGNLVFNCSGSVFGLGYGIYRIQNNTVDGAIQTAPGSLCNPAEPGLDCPGGTIISATFASNVQSGDIIIATANIDNNSTVIWSDPPEDNELSYASNQARISFANKTQSVTGSFTSSAQFSAQPLARAFTYMITIR